jgi:Xaa-Pro aminopeptidase
MDSQQRRQKAANLLQTLELDALVLCQRENLRYLCGFTGSDGALVVSADKLVFLTDSRYTTQAEAETSADLVCQYQSKIEGIVAQLRNCSGKRIGFEASLPFGTCRELQDKGDAGWQWRHLGEELHALRLHKSDDEISRIGAAADLHLDALQEVEQLIRPGTREREVALALEFALRRRGAEEKAFDIIVASGLRGAMPHAVAGDKALAEGDMVTIDFGCRLDGYHSDETVTLALGDVPEILRSVFDIVLEAHDRALAAVAPGIALAELDRIARDHINSHGYGDYFGHGLGHGVGLAVHEAPAVSARSKACAEMGMVFTIEPGIYLPGVGGVRIEDMVLVTAEGHRTLTKIPKTFRNILLN